MKCEDGRDYFEFKYKEELKKNKKLRKELKELKGNMENNKQNNREYKCKKCMDLKCFTNCTLDDDGKIIAEECLWCECSGKQGEFK